MIKRTNGLWYPCDKTGEYIKGLGNFDTLEEARRALEEYVQKLEIAPPIKKAEVKRSTRR